MPEELSQYQTMEQIDMGVLDKIAMNKGRLFAEQDKINTNQIRNIFSEITKMRTQYDARKEYDAVRKNLILLKPKLAYAAARQPKKMEGFKQTFDKLIDLVEKSQNKDEAIVLFFDFAEAIVAYHKYYETKK